MAKEKVEDVTEDMVSLASEIWLAGLGALATAQDEGGKLFSKLVQKGQGVGKAGKDEVEDQVGKARQEVRKQVSKAKDAVGGAWGDLTSSFDDQLGAALHRIGVPTRDEIKTLTERVEALMEKVDQLKPKAAPKPRTRKATTTKARTSAAAASDAKKAPQVDAEA